MNIQGLFAQLKKRRVIRATVIYVALLWAALQAADLFAGAEIMDVTTVRWLIIVGVAGLPLVVLASWFLESPWRERRWTSIAGDVVVITALVFAAALFAWQQWFAAFTRPTVAVLRIEATDTREVTTDLANHITRRFRLLLATRPEFRVIELGSSMHSALDELPLAARAEALAAQYVLAGTVSGKDENLRLSMQLFGDDGELIWSERFEGSSAYQQQLQARVLDDLWPLLPVGEEALAETRELVASCSELADSGTVYLEQARSYFDQIGTLPPPQRPVIQSMGLQALADASSHCPKHPDIELLRLVNTRELQHENAVGYIARHPNAAALYLALAGLLHEEGEESEVRALVNEALLLDPLGAATQCRAQELLESADVDDGACL